MTILSAKVSDVDTVGIGLAGVWDVIPQWLIDATEKSIRATPGELVSRMTKQNQLGLLSDVLYKTSLGDLLTEDLARRVSGELNAIQFVQDVIVNELAQVDKLLGHLNISPVYLKGIVSRNLYDVSYHRPFNDIDVLVDEEHALLSQAALKEMGFRQGRFNKSTAQFVPSFDAEEIADTGAYELPKLTKMVQVELIEPRMALNMQSNRLVIENGQVLVPVPIEIHYSLEADRRFPLDSRPANISATPNGRELLPEIQLAYLAYKLYTDIILLRARAGIKLLGDAIRLLKRYDNEIEWGGLLSRWHARGICAPLRYLLEHASNIYDCDFPKYEIRACPCRDLSDEIGDVTYGSPFDLGDFLPFLALSPPRFELQHN
ncbi:nucleotidyltransferase family protein [Roseibium album]|uniref:nucleotidyltransferase family protein n=1 Tax=Roseibium album TaxID=311410 RepID=UPI0039188832